MTSIIINYPDKNSFSKVLLNPSDPNPLKIWVGDLIEIKHIIVFGIEDKNGDECFLDALDIDVVMVNPKTNRINMSDSTKNTKVQIWLECGQYYKKNKYTGTVGFYHDTRLDCGADTFEEAIIKLAKLVKKYL